MSRHALQELDDGQPFPNQVHPPPTSHLNPPLEVKVALNSPRTWKGKDPEGRTRGTPYDPPPVPSTRPPKGGQGKGSCHYKTQYSYKEHHTTPYHTMPYHAVPYHTIPYFPILYPSVFFIWRGVLLFMASTVQRLNVVNLFRCSPDLILFLFS